jgi:DNA-binding transcriptional LysR family regulator
MQVTDRIGRRLKLHDLHVFMTVVQTGRMAKAARLLNTSQPAVSRSIADLEHTLGVRVLDRRRQGLEPTPHGRALLDCGAAVFDELRKGVKNIEFLSDPTAGEVRVGTITALASTFASAVIDRLHRRHRRIVFHLVTKDWEALRGELNERKLDLLLVQGFSLFSDELLEFDVLYDASYRVVAGAQHPCARQRKIRYDDLLKEAWVLPTPDSPFGAAAIAAFRDSGLKYPEATVLAAEADVRLGLIKSGRFLSMFTTSVLGFSSRHSGLKILPVQLPIKAVAPVGIVTLKNRTINPVGGLFIEAAREVAKAWRKP